MAESKRPKLISFGCERVNDKNPKETPKTVRISVILSEPTLTSYPEISYQEELLEFKNKQTFKSPRPVAPTNGLDPFNEDDDDVKRIAAQMEAKYGMGVTKKRKYRKDDFADIGMGYDESDSFIDNTDGYDEIVPKNVTTVLGGFYINSGALEFKTDEVVSSDDSVSSDDENGSNRKRILESASEEESPGSDKSEKKQKITVGLNGMQKAIKKRLFGHDKIKQMRKKRKSESKRTVRDLLNERRVDLDMSVIDLDPVEEKKDSLVLPESKRHADTVDTVIESVISATVKDVKKSDIIQEVKESPVKELVNGSLEMPKPDVDVSEAETDKSQIEFVQLPINLPSDILQILDSLKDAAALSTEGKVKFFTGKVNELLLNLEKKCRSLVKRQRNKVYGHLAPFVKCRKETLMKRAKNLVVIEEKKKIKILLDKLKAEVQSVMPALLQNYEDESKLVIRKKFSTDEEAKNTRLPKRHYTWNDNAKKLLRDIVTLQRKCFLNEGKQIDSLEQCLISFLKSEVQVIWPEKWVSISTLMKYSNLSKDKKPPESSKNGSTPVRDINDTINTSNSHIALDSNSGLTITPITPSNVNKTSFREDKSVTISPTETVITRINNDTSINKSSVSPESCRSLANVSPIKEEPRIDNSKEQSIIKAEDLVLNDIKIEDTVDLTRATTTQQDLNSNISIIDLTDQPELIRKPGPKSKTKYYFENEKGKKESSHVHDESIQASSNKSVTDRNSTSLNKSSVHSEGSNHYTNSVLKNQHDYLKPKDYSKLATASLPSEDLSNLKLTASDLSKIQISSNDLSKIKTSLNDISKMKMLPNAINHTKSSSDLSKTKSTAHELHKLKSMTDLSKSKPYVNDFTKIKSTSNDVKKQKTFGDYNRTKTISEGDDMQKALEGLMVLQQMSSPIKPIDESRSSSAVSVINYNKSYSQDSRHRLTSSSSSINNVNNINRSFQDAFQKQFIPDFMLKANQTSPSKSGYSLNHKSHSSSNDRCLQNSNHNFSQHNSNSKYKSVPCLSPQSANSKPSTHQK